MKRLITFIMILSMMASLLAGCQSGKKPSNEENTGNQTTESTQEAQNTEKNHTVKLSVEGWDAKNMPRFDGSLANEPLLLRMMTDLSGVDEETAEEFLLDYGLVNGGTSTSWSGLAYEENELVISYEPPAEVKESMAVEMESMEIDPLGRDGLVFIVNKDNPVESLTVDQIRDIYTGKITNWSEVGGNDGKIMAFQRNETSGSQTLLQKLVLGDQKPMEPDKDLMIGTMGGLIESVAAYNGSDMAIGFSVYYYADRMKSNDNLKMIKVEGIEPSNESIADGSYPLANDFYIAIRANEPENSKVRQVRDWMLTEDGKTLLEEEGYVWARNGMEAKSHGAGNIFK